jgi:hypothetical protein
MLVRPMLLSTPPPTAPPAAQHYQFIDLTVAVE